MQFKLIALVALAAITGFIAFNGMKSKPTLQQGAFPENYLMIFDQYQSNFGKQYLTEEEKNYRFNVFVNNYKLIKQHNANPYSTYTKGVNQFTDLTQEEFAAKYLMKKEVLAQIDESMFKYIKPIKPAFNVRNTTSFDWRSKGAVTPVKNQGQCGSCWAFSTTGSLEGLSKIAYGTLQSFSEQQLVDCCGPDGYQCQGCNGAWPSYALNWVKKHGITTEAAYPYKAVEGACKIDKGNFTCSGYTTVAAGNLDQLLAAVTKAPTSVCVDASNWSSYSKGIFDECTTNLDHAVLLTGWDGESWHVKNSWGTSWGESGYIQLKRANGANTCGIANVALFPNK